MNNKIKILISLFFLANILNAQEITYGSSLRELIDLISNETKIEKVRIGDWIEYEIYKYEITPKYSLLVSVNFYPFAVLVNDGTQYFLIDNSGNSVLDIYTTVFYVPLWVVFANSNEKNDNRNILQLFDSLYETFQSNESPHGSIAANNVAKEIVLAGNDLSYVNRDLIYGFYLYDTLFSSGIYNLSLISLNSWNNAMVSRYNTSMHPLLYIYSLETLYKLNEFSTAFTINNLLLEHYPNCIVGKVYQVLLEKNAIEQNRLRQVVIRDHGQHWLVKEKL